MIELSIQNRVRDQLLASNRSLALCALPGMGLSTILNRIPLELDKQFIVLHTDSLREYWECKYHNSDDKRFVLHEATIRRLLDSESNFPVNFNEKPDLNLVTFLRETNWRETNIIIDDFDELEDELATVVLDEIKFFDDNKSQEAYSSLRSVRFIISGYLDFNSLYFGKLRRGVSPATNFDKLYARDFILSESDIYNVINYQFPNVARNTLASQFVSEWSKGYLYYVIEIARLADKFLSKRAESSVHDILQKIKNIIVEQESVELFRYCMDGWKKIRNDNDMLNLLRTAVSSGYVSCTCHQARQIARLGFVCQLDPNKDEYYIPNKIIELFVRQRLAESGLAMSVEDGIMWAIKAINSRAYEVLLEIEYRLRTYIGDKLLYEMDAISVDEVLLEISSDQQKLEKIIQFADYKRKEDVNSPFNEGGIQDSLLSFMDFTDLGEIIRIKQELFPKRLGENLPPFISRLNYIRRQIAHNRQISKTQLDALIFDWDKMQRLMSFKDY